MRCGDAAAGTHGQGLCVGHSSARTMGEHVVGVALLPNPHEETAPLGGQGDVGEKTRRAVPCCARGRTVVRKKTVGRRPVPVIVTRTARHQRAPGAPRGPANSVLRAQPGPLPSRSPARRADEDSPPMALWHAGSPSPWTLAVNDLASNVPWCDTRVRCMGGDGHCGLRRALLVSNRRDAGPHGRRRQLEVPASR